MKQLGVPKDLVPPSRRDEGDHQRPKVVRNCMYVGSLGKSLKGVNYFVNHVVKGS